MKKQNGSAAVITLVVLGGLVALVGLAIMMFIGANNTAAGFDASVKYEHTNNKNVMAGYNQKVMEVAQVPDMMRDDFIKVATAAMEGRYGKDGSKAVFQMLTEQNPTLDPALYSKIQQVIESGRTEFQNSQTKLLDIKRSYEFALNSFPQGIFMRALGYPKMPLDTYNIVTTDRVERAFEKGKEDGPIQLRAKEPAPVAK
jgi:hypothetical protein